MMSQQQQLGFWLIVFGFVAIIIGLAFLMSNAPPPTPPKADAKPHDNIIRDEVKRTA